MDLVEELNKINRTNRKFFDFYLKGEKNNWPETPKVRLSVYDLEGGDVINRAENEFPLKRTKYTKLFLDAANKNLFNKIISAQSSAEYDSESENSEIIFQHKFEKETELTGYMKLHLWVSALDNDDMDLKVKIEKISADGKVLNQNNFGGVSADGQLRISCRKLDEKNSTEFQPILDGKSEQKILGGDSEEVADENEVVHSPQTHNKGRHKFYTGGKYDSYLLIPVIE